jgi:hypothetical protein
VQLKQEKWPPISRKRHQIGQLDFRSFRLLTECSKLQVFRFASSTPSAGRSGSCYEVAAGCPRMSGLTGPGGPCPPAKWHVEVVTKALGGFGPAGKGRGAAGRSNLAAGERYQVAWLKMRYPTHIPFATSSTSGMDLPDSIAVAKKSKLFRQFSTKCGL